MSPRPVIDIEQAGRNTRIDLLRAIAVLLVMVPHLTPPDGAQHPHVFAVIEAMRRPAWFGVDLFFVLSGFLVSGLLFKEYRTHGNIHPGRFLIRRASRSILRSISFSP